MGVGVHGGGLIVLVVLFAVSAGALLTLAFFG